MVVDLIKWSVNEYENEMQFQAAAFYMISQLFPRLRGKVWHTSNEDDVRDYKEKTIERRIIDGNHHKGQGVLAGVPDILIVQHGVLYKIELKQSNGRLSQTQKTLHALWLVDCTLTPTYVCYTLLQVYEAVTEIQKSNLIVCQKS